MNISETLMSDYVAQMPSRKKLNLFTTAQNSVITERQEEHGGSEEGPALLYSACLLLLLLC